MPVYVELSEPLFRTVRRLLRTPREFDAKINFADIPMGCCVLFSVLERTVVLEVSEQDCLEEFNIYGPNAIRSFS